MKKELIKKALEARELAYCPYSNFKVGAAALYIQDAMLKMHHLEQQTVLRGLLYLKGFQKEQES